jgi:hypothetical protein
LLEVTVPILATTASEMPVTRYGVETDWLLGLYMFAALWICEAAFWVKFVRVLKSEVASATMGRGRCHRITIIRVAKEDIVSLFVDDEVGYVR